MATVQSVDQTASYPSSAEEEKIGFGPELAKKIGPWIAKWQVASNSDPDKTYTVSLSSLGVWGCACWSWKRYRRECDHILQAQIGQGLLDVSQISVEKLRLLIMKMRCFNEKVHPVVIEALKKSK